MKKAMCILSLSLSVPFFSPSMPLVASEQVEPGGKEARASSEQVESAARKNGAPLGQVESAAQKNGASLGQVESAAQKNGASPSKLMDQGEELRQLKQQVALLGQKVQTLETAEEERQERPQKRKALEDKIKSLQGQLDSVNRGYDNTLCPQYYYDIPVCKLIWEQMIALDRKIKEVELELKFLDSSR